MPVQQLRCLVRVFCFTTLTLVMSIGLTGASCAQAKEVYQPLPSGSSNGALHYQRAMLFLAEVDPTQRELLRKPIWEIINSETSGEDVQKIDQLLIASRHAIRSAIYGARQTQANFGTNLREYAASTMLPHVGPMSSLAKLVTLHGIQKQAEGDMKRAAELFLNVVRMGSHLQQQPTLAESLEGESILETGYHALCAWAVRCSDPELIDSARSALNAISSQPASPSQALAYEASVLELSLDDVLIAYPDGNWAEIVLRAVDAAPESSSPEALRAAAKSAVIKRGVPESVFSSEEAFAEHIEKMRKTHAAYYQATLASLTLPSTVAISTGQKVYDTFAPRLKALGDPEILNPGRIAAYYAVQEAERQLANLVLVISAHREDGKFPADLTHVASHLGGELPENPLGSGEVVYQPTEDRLGFEIHYPGNTVAGIELPKVAFKFEGSK